MVISRASRRQGDCNVNVDRLRAAISARLRDADALDAGAAISPQSAVQPAGIVVSCVRLDSVMLAPLPDCALRLLYARHVGNRLQQCAFAWGRSVHLSSPGR